MSAGIDAEGPLDPGVGKRAVECDVALLEAREVVVADGEVERRSVWIGDVGRQAQEQVPAVEPTQVERLAEGSAEHVGRPARRGGFALRHEPEQAARKAE